MDLGDPRLVLPVPVYDLGVAKPGEFVTKRAIRPTDVARTAALFAYERAAVGAVPLAWSGPSCGARRLEVGSAAAAPSFWALPAPTSSADAGAGPAMATLYEYGGPSGRYAYSIDSSLSLAGFTRGAAIAQVWPSPIQVALPVADFLGDLVADAGPDPCVAATPADPSSGGREAGC